MLIFCLGIVRHPTELWRRIRELARIAYAPSELSIITSDNWPAVDLIPVTSDKLHQENLVAIYADNPSPYVSGPKSIEQLRTNFARGIQYYLVTNSDGDVVGCRAFNTRNNTLQNTVTAYQYRGHGYQLAAGQILMKFLAEDGCTEFHSAVLRSNSRIQRAMRAAGRKLKPDPDNPDLMRGVRRLIK